MDVVNGCDLVLSHYYKLRNFNVINWRAASQSGLTHNTLNSLEQRENVCKMLFSAAKFVVNWTFQYFSRKGATKVNCSFGNSGNFVTFDLCVSPLWLSTLPCTVRKIFMLNIFVRSNHLHKCMLLIISWWKYAIRLIFVVLQQYENILTTKISD